MFNVIMYIIRKSLLPIWFVISVKAQLTSETRCDDHTFKAQKLFKELREIIGCWLIFITYVYSIRGCQLPQWIKSEQDEIYMCVPLNICPRNYKINKILYRRVTASSSLSNRGFYYFFCVVKWDNRMRKLKMRKIKIWKIVSYYIYFLPT